jgi:hypothetical protein
VEQVSKSYKDIDCWLPLCEPNLNWKDQEEIVDTRINMCTAMLFHYNLDLAASGNHITAHWTANPKIIVQQVEGLLDQKSYDHLQGILICDGCPNVLNKEAMYKQYLEMYKYGNHKSVEQNLDKVMLIMNKEDRKDHGPSCLFHQ